jgi:hypothetical protein
MMAIDLMLPMLPRLGVAMQMVFLFLAAKYQPAVVAVAFQADDRFAETLLL